MDQIVTVKIEDCCRIDRYSADSLRLRRADSCVVVSERGLELGCVVHAVEVEDVPVRDHPSKAVLRRASHKDFAQFQRKRAKEERAWDACKHLVDKHALVMKLTRVECLFDGSKVIFYYTADGRVDFRELVKDLASSLKTRIEMRQIGVRDEAKILGGVGCCGLPLCCSSWLKGFRPVSIRVAKQQCLNLNPSRLSGVCGRLMCCLMYESTDSGDAQDVVEISEDNALRMVEGEDRPPRGTRGRPIQDPRA